MRGWQVPQFGPYREVLRWETMAEPSAAPGFVVVKVRAAGVNFPDILMIEGGYQVKPSTPFVPGMEIAGEVIRAAPGSRFRPGDRVMSMMPTGGFAEQVLAPEPATYPVPEGMEDAEAAAFQMIYQTSWFGVVLRGRLQAGETLLVHGGAGGVGTAAIQIGKAIGAHVIATAGGPTKLEVCRRAGADHAIDYTQGDFVDAVKQLTGGRGADVIYDPVGGDVFDASTRCIAWEGRLVVIGFTSGRIPSINANRILLKNFSVVGLHWGPYRLYDPARVDAAQQDLYRRYGEGQLRPIVWKSMGLSELPAALDALRSRESYGKVVLTP